MPGWDCHGLPIEHQVDKELKAKKHQLSQVEVRQRCRDYAEKFIDIQRDEFKRLGVLGDWDNPYLTMKYAYEAAILEEYGEFFQRAPFNAARSPSTGAPPAAPPWPRPRWSTRTTSPRRFT